MQRAMKDDTFTMNDLSETGLARHSRRLLLNVAGAAIGIGLIIFWGWAVAWALDDEERAVRDGSQDPRTTILPVLSR